MSKYSAEIQVGVKPQTDRVHSFRAVTRSACCDHVTWLNTSPGQQEKRGNEQGWENEEDEGTEKWRNPWHNYSSDRSVDVPCPKRRNTRPARYCS